ncbi:MAG: DUF4954 family protein [Chitinispirillales bacterium]|jgi:NDP-sugar pyrophosphorylase family protein|nr:DUF4954 family protein [Chitinispirillales bacterium]
MEEIIKKWHSQKAVELRSLRSDEIAQLAAQLNTASDWNNITVVADGFDAGKVHRCSFEGRIEIGAFKRDFLRYGTVALKVGLYGSHFRDSVIGSDAAIHNLLYCSRQFIGDNVIISNAAEISCSAGAAFGMGIIKNDENPVIELVNENGGRAVLPFPGMTCTDAFVWSRFRADSELMDRLSQITNHSCKEICPDRAVIADNTVILNVKAMRNTLTGPCAVIDGAELLFNSTILSDSEEPTKIGAAIQIRNSIIGYGNEINSAAQLSSVMTGTAVSISQAARINHSFIGDNAFISCCEIANSLIMPFHCQHHNNSFLIASIIGGQSNIAAGATVGSNHNSRTCDGELWAKRGFWPGLCTSFKHNCSFASFTMAAKGDYPAELDLKLPFSLLALDKKSGFPVIFPAFWFTHDMYAAMRSEQKFAKRDKRVHRRQFIEHNILAPDTVSEIFEALYLIELWTGKASFTAKGISTAEKNALELTHEGKTVLLADPHFCSTLDIKAENVERGRPATSLKNTAEAYRMYRMMVRYYCVKNLLPYMQENNITTLNELKSNLASLIETSNELNSSPASVLEWLNCGSMVITDTALSGIIQLIKEKSVKTWTDIHSLFDSFSSSYKTIKTCHALHSLAKLEGMTLKELREDIFWSFLQTVSQDCRTIGQLTLSSRAKDFNDPFRAIVYQSEDEMRCVLGSIEDSVIKQTAEEMEKLIALAAAYSMQPQTAAGDDFT